MDGARFIALIDALSPRDAFRRDLLRAAPLTAELLPALVATLEAIGPASPAAARLAIQLGQGFGRKGFSLAGAWWVDPYPDHAPPRPPDPVAEACAERGRALGGPVGDLLQAI